jgi:hypothetical protein
MAVADLADVTTKHVMLAVPGAPHVHCVCAIAAIKQL